MGLEGINFNKEQSDEPSTEKFCFSEDTLKRVRAFLSGKALENTTPASTPVEDTADHYSDGE